MLFYTKFAHALAFIFIAARLYMWYLFPGITGLCNIKPRQPGSFFIHHYFNWRGNGISSAACYQPLLSWCDCAG